MALYRRYRPQKFQDVIGQAQVTKPLMAALRADRTAHAYLFSGPRGCGKTTSARILARCLNCAQGPTDTPCGECESCQELSALGSGSLDVIEMDAASHGGVDDARDLVERASFSPARDRYKIFIVDEAHMVTNQGFNALLKLVEEPPEHVKFIFATTEPEKVIPTIRSRTHHYPFRLVPPELLEEYMASLCSEEGVDIGGGVLPLVVRAGGGSVRDSLSVLDQLIGGAESSVVSYEEAIGLLGYTDSALLDDAVEAIAADDGASLFAVVDRVVKSGHSPRRFVEDLLQHMRDLVIVSLAGEQAADVVTVAPDQLERMRTQAAHLGAGRASRSADLINEALSGMVGATSPQLQLELLCARLLIGAAPQQTESPLAHSASAQSHTPPPVSSSSPGAGSGPSAASKALLDSLRGGGKNAAPREDTPKPKAGPAVSAAWTSPSAPVAGDFPSPGQMRSGYATANETQPAPAQPVSAQATPRLQEPAHQAPAQQEQQPVPQKSVPQESVRSEENAVKNAGVAPAYADATIVRQRWNEVVEAMRNMGGGKSAAALVGAHAQIGSLSDGVLTLLFNSQGMANAFHEGHAEIVSKALYDVLGIRAQARSSVGGEGHPKAEAGTHAGDGNAHGPASRTPNASAPATPATPAPPPTATPVSTPAASEQSSAVLTQNTPVEVEENEPHETPEECQIFPDDPPSDSEAYEDNPAFPDEELTPASSSEPTTSSPTPNTTNDIWAPTPEAFAPQAFKKQESENLVGTGKNMSFGDKIRARHGAGTSTLNNEPAPDTVPPDGSPAFPDIPDFLDEDLREEMRVSSDDPTLEESDIIGINVVVNVLGGTIISEGEAGGGN